ncbi:MAG TPA: hypothetical protein VHZ73_10610 [Vicinamibacterales bacterium]|jgi:hypothetical protein|nr:hypothetical protein [Vicinamibacterales bacterium]
MQISLKSWVAPSATVIAMGACLAIVQGCGNKSSGHVDGSADAIDVLQPRDAQSDRAKGRDGAAATGSDAASPSDASDASDAPLTSPPINCGEKPEQCAFCSGNYATISVQRTAIIRGTWQYNPGGPYVTLPGPGYPCAAFSHDDATTPLADDDHWIAAPDGAFIGFRQSSVLTMTGYVQAQFRYFRTLVFVPSAFDVKTFTVAAQGVDDSVHIVIFNSKYPNGVSPTDAGPSDPTVGACGGFGDWSWDFKSYVQPGEINVFFLVQADLNPSTSSLVRVDLRANGAPIPLYDCVNPPALGAPGVEPPGEDAGVDDPGSDAGTADAPGADAPAAETSGEDAAADASDG